MLAPAVLLSLLFIHSDAAAPHLQSYSVDSGQVSVSGISSGACMATQYHVALSAHVMGVGVIAGAPFMCSGGNVATSTGICMVTPSLINLAVLEGIAASAALVGNIDSTSHLRHDRVYVFAGAKDTLVNPAAGHKVEGFYRHYISDNSNFKTVYNMDAGHGQPTENYGGPCGSLNIAQSYMNNCGYSAAYDLLNHFYGGHLRKPGPHDSYKESQLLSFDQSEFFYISAPIQYSMASTGYVYVPTACAGKHTKCKLHIAFHGCGMSHSSTGMDYMKHAGYNEVGELNNIIILYPQIIVTPVNPTGCWDWWGYTGPLFATKNGFQITAVRRMMDRVLGAP